MYWRCERKDSCRARVHTKVGSSEIIYRGKTGHSHAPNLANVKAQRVRQKLRDRARDGKEPDHRVLGELCENLDDAVLSQLPPIKSLKKVMRYVLCAPRGPAYFCEVRD